MPFFKLMSFHRLFTLLFVLPLVILLSWCLPSLQQKAYAATTIGQDTFTRANQSLWGTASDGQTWGGDANGNSIFSINNNTGLVTSGGSNAFNAILGTNYSDEDVVFSGTMSNFTNSNIGAVVRYTDTNNWYKAYIDGTSLIIQKKVSGTTTTLNTVSFSATNSATYSLRFQAIGTTLNARVWNASGSEPGSWMATATDSSFSSGKCGLRMLTQTGITATFTSFLAQTFDSITPTPTPTITPTPTVTPTPTNTPTPTPTPIATAGLIAQDTFTRANQSLWGTASDGNTWGADANTNSIFSISSNQGLVSGTGGTTYSGILGPNTTDSEVYVTGSLSSFTSSNFGALLRFTDSNNWYKGYIDGSALYIQKKVSGTTTILKNTSFIASAGTLYTIHFRVIGSILRINVWASTSVEPSGWMLSTSDTSLASGYDGIRTVTQSGTATFTAFSAYGLSGTAESNTNTITVDYTQPIQTIDSLAYGMDISGYFTPNTFGTDLLEQQKLQTLGSKYFRMDLKYTISGDPTSNIVCGGSGCDTSVSGDQWINAIKSIGGTPVILVHFNTAADAANLVKHFNIDTNNPVKYWIIGNEPDINGYTAASYSAVFNQDYDAMKAIDPTIKIGGGATSSYLSSYLQTFLQNSSTRVDFVDFHGYAQQGNVSGNTTTLFQTAQSYGINLKALQALIQTIIPSRAAQISTQIGEWELNFNGSAQDDINFHALWAASAFGNILQAGGRGMFFADKGNLFYHDTRTINSVTVNLDDTNPAYHGMGMFTGENLFQGFGSSMVQTATALPSIEVFASDNPKSIVVINEDASTAQSATFSLIGVSTGSVDVWRKDESVLFPSPPVQVGTTTIQNNSFTYTLPAFSVTTFIVTPSTTTTTSSSNASTNQNTPGAPNPNFPTGYYSQIMAGPHYLGSTIPFISGSSGAGAASIFIPPGAVHDDVTVEITPAPLPLLTQFVQKIPFPWMQRINTAGDIFNFHMTAAFNGMVIQKFDKPITIVLPYDSNRLYGRKPKQLKIAMYNPTTKRWNFLTSPMVVNMQNHTIATTVTSFSYFTVGYPRK